MCTHGLKMKLLVLDLDETLIHAAETPFAHGWDFTFHCYYVYKRPHLDKFIEYCLKHFQVAVWTSSSESYANEIVRNIFPNPADLRFMFARNKCVHRFDSELVDYYYLKDLNKVKKMGFSLKDIIAIDDSPEKFKRHYGNLVRIKPFEGDCRDSELLRLINYLEVLNVADNIRTIEKRGWYVNVEID